jgi:hypothetical protein
MGREKVKRCSIVLTIRLRILINFFSKKKKKKYSTDVTATTIRESIGVVKRNKQLQFALSSLKEYQ